LNSSEKIDIVLKVLGISSVDYSDNVIDKLYEKINHIQKISEFNAILIKEMIEADIIPPLLLKKSQILSELKDYNYNLSLLSNRYEIYQKQKTEKNILNFLAKDMLDIQIKIEKLEEDLKHL
jgi:hypothetical protein